MSKYPYEVVVRYDYHTTFMLVEDAALDEGSADLHRILAFIQYPASDIYEDGNKVWYLRENGASEYRKKCSGHTYQFGELEKAQLSDIIRKELAAVSLGEIV